MDVVTRTPFKFAPHPGRLRFPGHSLTYIVKATFDLVHDGVVTSAEEQPPPTGDVYYPDDEDMQGGCRCESDYAYAKPRADLLLVGHCHTPGGQAVRSCPVAFEVGSRRKELLVFGDRSWKGPLGLGSMTKAVPFERMELRYEHGFGGTGSKRNPVGRGQGRDDEESSDGRRLLPNIEDPDALVRSPLSRPAPAGFGPLSRQWKDRFSKVGTYKKRWLKERWPWLPEDFDFAHYNAASEDMQVAGYLRGDEVLRMENLHPEHPLYSSRLPGIRIRLFVNERVSEGDEPENFRFSEIPMDLDTLWVDMDAEQLSLVWRGWGAVRGDEFEEIEEVFFLSEEVDQEPATLEECRAAFEEARTEEAEEVEVEVEGPEEPEIEEEPEPEPEFGFGATAAAVKAQLAAQFAGALALVGLDASALSPDVQAQVDRDLGRIADGDTEDDRYEQEQLEQALDTQLSKLGLETGSLPPPSPAASQEQLKLLQAIGVEDAAGVAGSPEVAPLLAALAAVLPSAGIDPTNLDPMIGKMKEITDLAEAPEPEEGEAEADPDEEERIRPLTREIVEDEAARGLSFDGEDLRELDLSGLALVGLDFSGADFRGAQLRGTDLSSAILAGSRFEGADLEEAILEGADLGQADLSRASLRKASLDGADATGAVLKEAVLDGASLAGTLLLGAEMSRASLIEVAAGGAWFNEAVLKEAIFDRAELTAADFARADVSGARFSEAILVEASIEGARCVKADFSEADLTRLRASESSDFTGACFTKVKAGESIWGEADLSEADFSYAFLQEASFYKARLQRANLYAADLRGAKLIRADLSDANATMIDLFEGSLEKADLSGADFSGSNLYGAELVDVIVRDTRFDDTNLRMTKLA